MKKNITEQMKKDFGEFPIKGLTNDSFVEFDFFIKDSLLKKLQSLPHDFLNIVKIVRIELKKDEVCQQEIKELKKSIDEIKSNLSNTKERFGFLVYILISGFYLAVFPLVLVLFILVHPKTFFKSMIAGLKSLKSVIKVSIKQNFAEKNVLGHVSRLSEDTININSLNKKIKDEIISHEAFHLIQFRHINKNLDDRNRNPQLQSAFPYVGLSEEEFSDYQRYILNRFELEVVLHEFIRNHYLKNQYLPVDVIDFEQLMFAKFGSLTNQDCMNGELGSDLFLLKILCFRNGKNQHEKAANAHEGLTVQTTNDFYRRNIHRVINEWLAPCYANLLQYYGDEKAAMRFRSQIMGPNLYNRVYRSPH